MKKIISIVFILAFITCLIPGVANAKLVTCVGDSITYGYGIPNRNENSYPAQLAELLQSYDSEWETKNSGANGATLLRNGDQPYIRKGVYNPALASAPDVVIIMLGTNDSWPSNWVHKDNFVSDYLALIDAFAELPTNPKIFICCPPPIWGRPWGLDGTVLKDQIIPLIGEVAELRDVEVIDLHSPLEDSSDLLPDGCHPNTEGARMIAEVVASAILGSISSPDFNGDEIVDIEDLIMLIDHWGQNERSVDIAPAPFGDGIVDAQDLEVLMSYWLQEFLPVELVAYWKLDEIEGMAVVDSAGDNNGYAIGDPVWQPDAGLVNGALQLDGIDDYVITEAALNPADGPFSVLAWINSGAPGQVVILQQGAANWLMADVEGNLMTELKGSGRSAAELLSQAIITDGEWHRIGFVWDGSNRTLYVDGVAVTQDTQDSLGGSVGGLYIGCGKNMEAGTFWSGLIDDVRIYNQAVMP
jgi:lysophospholipase L1-like esterase